MHIADILQKLEADPRSSWDLSILSWILDEKNGSETTECLLSDVLPPFLTCDTLIG
jgi:hypothetical protein